MKKTLSSVLSIVFVFVFAFMAASSGKKADKPSVSFDDLFGTKTTEELTTEDVYGFTDYYVTYTDDYIRIPETSTTTTTRPTTTRPTTTVSAVTRPTAATTTRPVTTRMTTTTRPMISPTTRVVTTTTPSANVSLNSTDISAVVNFYNDAVRRTYSDGAPQVYQSMGLRGNITGSGGIAPYISELQEILETDTDAFSGSAYGIPGEDEIETISVSNAYATSTGGKTRIYISFKDFSVTMEDIDNLDPAELPDEFNDIFDGFGSSVASGRNTVRLSLSNSYIECDVDERTGEIISGTWNYDVDFIFGNAAMEISGVTLSLIDFCIPMRLRVTL